jgi:hypothetical protein
MADAQHTPNSAAELASCPEPVFPLGSIAQFDDWARQWKSETRYVSSTSDMVLHPAYQRIIGLGPAAVPLILDELRREPNHWFWALKAITGEDPVPPADRGRLDRMTAAWLAWGQRAGFRAP